ncbi:hypothetical protein [Lunatibacter salilacus]|uniref:hypothetical protein n=1 Tax=Lunatibacter salilacus TaxID=2483804 RepID=UPI00131E1D24|nr:hypothetical protein [Lunatibacter salilacus]
MNFETCPITGIKIKSQDFQTNIPIENSYTYRVPTIGEVTLSHQAWLILEQNSFQQKPILAGYCRNIFDRKGKGPKIQTEFINEGYKSVEVPFSFEEKCRHLLEYLYEAGGKESKTFNLNSLVDYTITYSPNPDEFNRIIEHLKLLKYITYKSKDDAYLPKVIFFQIALTIDGFEQAKKSLPTDPMIRLIREDFGFGDEDTNEKVNHAIKLFHTDSSMDNKRSACETLSFILEPLRNELKVTFSGDTEDFLHCKQFQYSPQ